MTRPNHIFVPRIFANIALVGHVSGAAALGVAGAFFGAAVAIAGAFAGGAFGGLLGVFLGVVVLSSEPEFADVSTRVSLPPRRPWVAIGAGVAASVAVCLISVVGNFQHGGFLEGSPCEDVSAGRGAHLRTIETLLPAQYTCVYSGGTFPLVAPALLIALTLLSLAGAVAIGWGLWRLRGNPAAGLDRFFLVLAVAVGLFLSADALAGMFVLVLQAAS